MANDSVAKLREDVTVLAQLVVTLAGSNELTAEVEDRFGLGALEDGGSDETSEDDGTDGE
jgi:hypothetical protein